MAVPKVAAIHDLSGLGRCSLTAAIPILAAMGVQACPLPTAVLSNQTGFSSFACVELTGELESFVQQWQRLGVQFDGVYTGFLVNEEQVRLIAQWLEGLCRGDTMVLVDPVLGDNGSLYPVFSPTMVEAVKGLVAKADIITPNLTEACLLTGIPYELAATQPDVVWEIAERLAGLGPHTVVISGVHRGDSICNLAYLARENRRVSVCNRRIGGGYSGTGDVLASIVCGSLVQGRSVEDGLQKAAVLFEQAIADTHRLGSDPNQGIAFEPHLHLLYPERSAPNE